MSLLTDAEQVRELASKIVRAEHLRDTIQQNGGVIFLLDDPTFPLTPTAAQRAAALDIENTWKQQIKAIAATW